MSLAVAVEEEKGIVQRCWEAVSGNWWKLLGEPRFVVITIEEGFGFYNKEEGLLSSVSW